MTATCPRRDELLRLLDGELAENRASDLREHAQGCRRCADEMDRQRQFVARIAAPVAPPSEEAVQALMARLDEATAPQTRRSSRWSWALGGAGLAAAACLAVVLLPRGTEIDNGFAPRGEASQWHQRLGFELYALAPEPRPLTPGASVSPQTTYLGSYRNLDVAPAYLLAFGIDARGEVHWLYPGFTDPKSDPWSVRLEPTQSTKAFGESVLLDDLPVGALRIVSIISPAPLQVSLVESLPAAERDVVSLRARWAEARVDELAVQVHSSAARR